MVGDNPREILGDIANSIDSLLKKKDKLEFDDVLRDSFICLKDQNRKVYEDFYIEYLEMKYDYLGKTEPLDRKIRKKRPNPIKGAIAAVAMGVYVSVARGGNIVSHIVNAVFAAGFVVTLYYAYHMDRLSGREPAHRKEKWKLEYLLGEFERQRAKLIEEYAGKVIVT